MVSAHNRTHDLDVQYSMINHDLMACNVQVTENNCNNGKSCMCAYNIVCIVSQERCILGYLKGL